MHTSVHPITRLGPDVDNETSVPLKTKLAVWHILTALMTSSLLTLVIVLYTLNDSTLASKPKWVVS